MFNRLKLIIFNLLALWYFRKKNFYKAEKYTQALLEKAIKKRDIKAQALFIGNLALVYKEKGEYQRAIHICEEAIQYNIADAQKLYLSQILGETAYLMGDYKKAVHYLRNAEELASYFGYNKQLIEIKYLTGLSMALMNDEYKAVIHLEEALKIAKSLRDSYHEGYANLYLAHVYEKFNKNEKVITHYEEAQRIFKRIGAKGLAKEVEQSLKKTI